MKTISLNNNIIEVYDSIETAPVTNYMQMNRFALIDSGIGSDIHAIDGHISLIRQYLSKEDIKNADKELLNMRQSYAFLFENLSPKMLSFVAMIKTVNGKKVEVADEEQARALIAKLSRKGLTFEQVTSILTEVKKKLIQSLKSFFRNRQTVQKLKPTTKV